MIRAAHFTSYPAFRIGQKFCLFDLTDRLPFAVPHSHSEQNFAYYFPLHFTFNASFAVESCSLTQIAASLLIAGMLLQSNKGPKNIESSELGYR